MLSNQAKWYLTGLKRNITCSTNMHGTPDPEPTAMNELIAAGLVITKKSNFKFSNQLTYRITSKGMDYNEYPR